MKRRMKIALGLGLAALLAAPALADLNYTQGDGVTRNIVLFDFTCFTTKHCSAHVPINSSGAELFTSASPGTVTMTTVPAGASTAANQVTNQTLLGSLTETAPGTDTASSGLNGRLQRVAQRLTSLIALLPTSLGAGGGLKVDGSGTALPVVVNNTLTALTLGGNSASPVADPATDPCQMITNSSTTINLAAATATQLIPASASNKNYICSVDLFSKAGVDISVVEGTGGNCQTGTAGIIGTMSVTGISIPAQGGVVKGGTGRYVWRTNGTNVGTCIATSSTNALTGFLKYVQAP